MIKWLGIAVNWESFPPTDRLKVAPRRAGGVRIGLYAALVISKTRHCQILRLPRGPFLDQP